MISTKYMPKSGTHGHYSVLTCKNDASESYNNFMRKAIKAIHQAMDLKKDFDITINDDREINGYINVIQI